jgi:hypothetical protein
VIPQDPTHPPAAQTQPKTDPQQLVLGFWPQPPPPGLVLANVLPHHCLHVINVHPPPSSITPHCRFTRRAQNQATNIQFLGFWLNPSPLVSRWQTRSAPAASTSSTRTHHLPASSHIAVSHGTPETEQRTLGFGILAQN